MPSLPRMAVVGSCLAASLSITALLAGGAPAATIGKSPQGRPLRTGTPAPSLLPARQGGHVQTVEVRGPRRQDVHLLHHMGLLAEARSRLNFFRERPD